jgi:hypothetical protein
MSHPGFDELEPSPELVAVLSNIPLTLGPLKPVKG